MESHVIMTINKVV